MSRPFVHLEVPIISSIILQALWGDDAQRVYTVFILNYPSDQTEQYFNPFASTKKPIKVTIFWKNVEKVTFPSVFFMKLGGIVNQPFFI